MVSGQKDYSNVSDMRLAGKVYGRTVLVTVMSIILYVSLLFLFNSIGTHSIGYQLYEKVEGGDPIAIGDPYYYKDGEGPVPDIELEENQTYMILRSELDTGMTIAFNVIAQSFMLILLLMLPYGIMKERGEKDRNLTRYEHKSADLWRGLRVGLISSAPSFVLYIVWLVSQCMPNPTTPVMAMFRIANYPFTPLLSWLIPQQTGVTVLGAVGVLVLLLLVPGICALGYRLGYKNISIMERIVYQKK